MQSMKFYIITSIAGRKIEPIQRYLFHKYLPEIRPQWIDLEDKPLSDWCANVAEGIESNNPTESIALWLDDHLLLDRVVRPISMPNGLERLELGQRTSNHKTCIHGEQDWYLTYTNETPYKVSCQPSVWKTDALLRELRRVNGSPWDFESQGSCVAGIVAEPVVKVADESALSQRWRGVNLRGMKAEDRDEILKRNYINICDIRK